MAPLLGYILPPDRTAAQHEAASDALAAMPHFTLSPVTMARGDRVMLTNAWKHPDVVRDAGLTFDRIHQLSGSCVWAGGTNAVFTTIATQRLGPDPVQAFLPFTLHNYAMSRHYSGDDSEGEGSMGATFAESLRRDGLRDWPKIDGDEMPDWKQTDGVMVTKADEMHWSSIHNPNLDRVLAVTRKRLVGGAAQMRSVADIKAAVQNGYGVTFACSKYIGSAHVIGEGKDACVVGEWDGNGGHQQSVHNYWEHPDLGPLYWAQNNWPGSTYPRDPAGGPVCGCWVKEAKVADAMRYYGEVFAVSHVPGTPARPDVLDWATL